MNPIRISPTEEKVFLRVLNDRLAELDAAIESVATPAAAATVTASAAQQFGGSHAQRLAILPTALPEGTTFYERDRTTLYVVAQAATGGRVWQYHSGVMVVSTLADKPNDLDVYDAGFCLRSTDCEHVWRWNGSAWKWADARDQSGEIVWRKSAPAGNGWKVANGSTQTVWKEDATSVSEALPDLIGKYPKGATTYTGTPVAAVQPGLTGQTGDESGHTHGATIPAMNTTAPNAGTVCPTGAGQNMAVSNHFHSTPVTAITTAAGSAHHHDKGTLAVDATGEPAHLELIPYFRQ